MRAIGEYAADHLERAGVREVGLRDVVTLSMSDSVAAARAWIASGAAGTSHPGFPLLDGTGRIAGVVTRKDIYREVDPATPLHGLCRRAPVVIGDDGSLRDAAELMANEGIGRLPVVARAEPHSCWESSRGAT